MNHRTPKTYRGKLPKPDKRGYVRPEIGDKRFTVGNVRSEGQGEMERRRDAVCDLFDLQCQQTGEGRWVEPFHGFAKKLANGHPASLVSLPNQNIPSRGWGEDFWVKVDQRSGSFFRGTVDNLLAESRLHGLNQGDGVYFNEDHILAIHNIHRQELVLGMDVADLKEVAQWVGQMRHE